MARRLELPSLAIGLVLAGLVRAASAPLSPEETVERYLHAVKDGHFDEAYELVSKDMKRGKDKEVWVKEQKTGMSFAEVKIFAFHVQPAKVDGDTARVPNILDSQDRFVNQLGLTEYELYTLVKEDGRWKVDQQTIVEPSDVPKWFPEARKGPPK
ncbi:MAG: DUF4878 domain-containing protein [Deltaproteobacteria bacterium]|nr:MAG: DUF4878 domain-containing protein [Deltaproteobacteria bacterium]